MHGAGMLRPRSATRRRQSAIVHVSAPTCTCSTSHSHESLRENPSVAPTVQRPGPTRYPSRSRSPHVALPPLPLRAHPRPRLRLSYRSGGRTIVASLHARIASRNVARTASGAPSSMARAMYPRRRGSTSCPSQIASRRGSVDGVVSVWSVIPQHSARRVPTLRPWDGAHFTPAPCVTRNDRYDPRA